MVLHRYPWDQDVPAQTYDNYVLKFSFAPLPLSFLSFGKSSLTPFLAFAHLWSILLELAALVDEFFPGLLAFILSVGQGCGGGIQFFLWTDKGNDSDEVPE